MSNGQTLFQEVFRLKVCFNGLLADKKICIKKIIIDFLTLTVSFITIIFSNKSIGDIVLGTTVVKEN